MFSMAMGMITVVAPLQILAGDQHGLNTLEHQPVKVMAMEGHFKSYTDGAPLILFGWPDEAKAETLYAVEIPKASSLILKHSLDAPLKGLDSVDRKEWPPVLIVFWSFRVMVGLGMAMLGLAAFSLLARVMHRLYDWTLLHLLALVMGPAGFAAVIAGWVTTEVGRQPYTVHGLLRTADSASPLQAPAVGTSLLAFIAVYCIVFGAGIFYILRLMSHPPQRARRGPNATSRCGRPASRRRRRCPTRSPRRAGGTDHAHLRPAHHLGLHHRLRDLRLCRDGRLRSRHRHPVLLDPGRPRARHRDQHHRPGMGRQRDLAGAGRRRPSGGLSAGLRHDPVGALRADRGHAAGADLPRRRLRVPLARPPPPSLLGCRLQRRLDHGGLRAGRHPGRPAAGHRRQGSRLCRRLVRLADSRSACWSA